MKLTVEHARDVIALLDHLGWRGVHLRTPGREDEETLRSGTEAAAAGGE